MKTEDQNRAIAECIGFELPIEKRWHGYGDECRMTLVDRTGKPIPNYTDDLNAINEAVIKLPHVKQPYYMDNLTMVLMNDEGVSDFDRHTATAEQRAEALLRTIGLWNFE
jgi:hypothetical protein